jgi:uncharacterized membrane protein
VPNPKNYIPNNYTFVKAYVRRAKGTKGTSNGNRSGCLFLIVLAALGIVALLIYTLWPILLGIGLLVVGIYVVLNWRKWKQALLARRVRSLEKQQSSEEHEALLRARLEELKRAKENK